MTIKKAKTKRNTLTKELKLEINFGTLCSNLLFQKIFKIIVKKHSKGI